MIYFFFRKERLALSLSHRRRSTRPIIEGRRLRCVHIIRIITSTSSCSLGTSYAIYIYHIMCTYTLLGNQSECPMHRVHDNTIIFVLTRIIIFLLYTRPDDSLFSRDNNDNMTILRSNIQTYITLYSIQYYISLPWISNENNIIYFFYSKL